MFRFLHKNLEAEELEDIEEMEKDLGKLNNHLSQAHQIIRLFSSGNVSYPREMDIRLKENLLEAERLLKKMGILDHQAIHEQVEREAARERMETEEKAFLASIEQKYHIKFGFWDGRANMVEIKGSDGYRIAYLEMPHLMGFSNPDFKKILEERLIPILYRNGLLTSGSHSRGFDLNYVGDSKERLYKMGCSVDGSTLHTPFEDYDLNVETPTKTITFFPDKNSFENVILESINIKNIRDRYILTRRSLEQFEYGKQL